MKNRLQCGFHAAMTALLIGMGCTKDSSSITLYVFDGASSTIKAWDDLEKIYDAGALPEPSRIIQSGALSSVKDLAWGGMVVDPYGNRIFLVAKNGALVRIDRIRSQNGDVPKADTTGFTLNSDMGGSNFGQAALDNVGTLYIPESTNNSVKLWILQNAGTLISAPTEKKYITTVEGDKLCNSAACQGSAVFAYFGQGNEIEPLNTKFYGARVRMSSGGSFIQNQNTLINQDPEKFGTIGSLAMDTANNYLFICHRNGDTEDNPTLTPIVAYSVSDISQGPVQRDPLLRLGTFDSHPNLRFIAHGGNRQWLAAADSVNGAPSANIYLWKDPATPNSTPKTLSLEAGAQVLGMGFAE